MNYGAVLFDLDGTLLDTLADIAESMNTVLRQQKLPDFPLEAYKRFIGDGIETLVRRVLPHDRCDPAFLEQCTQLMRAEYGRRWDAETQPYDGIPRLLDALTTRGIPMGVLSNKPDEFTWLCVERLLPRWQFAVVIGAQPALPRKPDPAGAVEVARRFGVPPSQVVYVGDTNTDMQTAVGAGMLPVGALWGFRTRQELLTYGARVLVEHPLELLSLFDSSAVETDPH